MEAALALQLLQRAPQECDGGQPTVWTSFIWGAYGVINNKSVVQLAVPRLSLTTDYRRIASSCLVGAI